MKKFVMTALIAVACTAGAYASTSNVQLKNRAHRNETKSKKHHVFHRKASKNGNTATPMK